MKAQDQAPLHRLNHTNPISFISYRHYVGKMYICGMEPTACYFEQHNLKHLDPESSHPCAQIGSLQY